MPSVKSKWRISVELHLAIKQGLNKLDLEANISWKDRRQQAIGVLTCAGPISISVFWKTNQREEIFQISRVDQSHIISSCMRKEIIGSGYEID